MKELLQEIVDSKDKNDDDDEQIDDPSNEIVIPNHSDDLNVEEAQLLKKEAELPIEELLKRYGDDAKHFQSPMISKRSTQNLLLNEIQEKANELLNKDSKETEKDDQLKTDVVTHADEENTPADDVLDQKIADTTSNGEISNSTVCIRLSCKE